MIIKLLGCFLIIFASVQIGLSINEKQKTRIKVLEEILYMLETFKIKFEYEQTTVLKLLENLSINGGFFIKRFSSVCIQEIKKGKSLELAWEKAVNDIAVLSKISAQSINKLKEFATNLGKTALNGQISIIDFYIEEFKKDLQQENDKMKQNSKVYMSCSIFGGLVFVIILL